MHSANFSHYTRCLLLLMPLLATTAASAQNPRFHLDPAASTAAHTADVFADNCIGAPEALNVPFQFFTEDFAYENGLADWGTGGTIVVNDGAVTSSGDPVARLDGDDSSVLQLAWLAYSINSASVPPSSPCYTAISLTTTDATFVINLDNLVTGAAYDVHYRWTYEARGDEENEVLLPPDDPTFGTISLDLDIGLFGPGHVFDAVVDNDNITPAPPTELGQSESVVQFIAPSGSIPITVNMDAFATQTMVYPSRDDAARCFMRGTLDIWIVPPGAPADPAPLADSNVIISEVVDGAVGNSNPRYAELTNCGNVGVQFGPGDELVVLPDGAAIPSAVVDLSGVFLAPGESFVVAGSALGGDLDFLTTYGFNADLYDPGLFGDGNDVYVLLSAGAIHDAYGVAGVDPIPPLPAVPAPWAYADSHAHRKPNRFPNKGFFDSDNWIIAPLGSLQGANDFDSAALALAQTTPGAHDCDDNPAPLLGDLNCDGVVGVADVEAFALALVDPNGFALAYPACDILAADMNGDGLVNGLDVALFIAAL
ncbi:MAG: hypothetical protein H6819_13095 [Phycisphaerales bacterium]|nr:hypothetical protein [Phycisphaerales bacterium]MCB9855773.1 hypothetical protein [Phycisphaerales bacterium]MCB9862668.1 hypothetical protein [Phycisphaerales bacterium]